MAALLSAQLDEADLITRQRRVMWDAYHDAFESLEQQGVLRRPFVPRACQHNAHMYYLLLSSAEARTEMIEFLRHKGVAAVFHYVPLHSSPAGKRYGRSIGELTVTDDIASRIVRLPLWFGLEPELERVILAVTDFFSSVEA